MNIRDVSLSDFRENADRNRTVIRAISEGLLSFNLAMRPDPSAAPITLVAYDDNGELCAGLIGRTAWGWLRIDAVWVSEASRRRGIGRKLVHKAEKIAKDRGCQGAHLDTFGFQAPGFYSNLGYQVFGQLENYPDETHFFFRKDL